MKLRLLLILTGVILLTGCEFGPDSPRGFSLPQGSPDKGETAIFRHRCLSCHEIVGLEAESATVAAEIPQKIVLGGQIRRVATYAELVTSVINPSHRISRTHEAYVKDQHGNSIMRNYNDVMTVSELVDIVAYLQPLYEVEPYTYTPYQQYYPQ